MTGHCSLCQKTKLREEFHRNQTTCKSCHTIRQREYRHTLRGFLDQKYTAMSRRVRGKDRNCAHLMTGLPILPRKDFIVWAYAQENLVGLFTAYRNSGWDFKLCPVIDRLDEKRGYELGNIRFITQSENSIRAWRSEYRAVRMLTVARGEKISGVNWRAGCAAK